MCTRQAMRFFLALILALTMVPSLSFGQAKPGQAAARAKETIVIQARDGGFLPQGILEQIRAVPNVRQTESFLEGMTADGRRVIGVESAPTLHLRSGDAALAAVIVQGRGLEAGDAPEAMVVGQTFAQHNKTALGLSIPAMLTKDHFPPIIVGGQGFSIVGIYATGDAKTDDQVLVLLPTAQTLLNQPGRLSGVYVTPAAPAAAEQVAAELRLTLGDAVEVAPVARRQR
ncbi:MAG TPA: ABC transporter permease [Alphaproteobacteria bacterium]|nr:ABC transporter permease [Alphaproteobacteria bacterium]